METASVTSKGQVTIPKEIRQKLGIREGSKVEFAVVGKHLELRVQPPNGVMQTTAPASGYGMVKSRRNSVPVDLDPASLLKP
ncbi:AbrB/MazE/SpoVT family DNA-binding domain-containing protein [Rugamonas sp. FT82W]|uniref:AbrB/MazE/SpoVT family DNA-binding domain-containing protein n=1 Tax=Duganella vulcania TaxID=2692166 RepID=A0A845G4W2_9BURK|nr:AbrB/MazE/SpoVT family DNA-binding domain-containing protein [Duganella vulcania]MYM87758.1 AbrB/MazE/SpoVT family DNA-binding domain-containing protein [Duganella vulcania]